jgi:RNA 2',3'-cyclic 3'-phosphodiesterase
MKRRIFISIDIPSSVRKAVERSMGSIDVESWGYRLVMPELWHITLIFLGDQGEDQVLRTIDILEKIIPNFEVPNIQLNNFSFAPTINRPRMIWLNGSEETSIILAPIYTALTEELDKAGIRFDFKEKRFNAHVTIARAKRETSTSDSAGNLPEIKSTFSPETVRCVESVLTKMGPEYTVLSSHSFRDEEFRISEL